MSSAETQAAPKRNLELAGGGKASATAPVASSEDPKRRRVSAGKEGSAAGKPKARDRPLSGAKSGAKKGIAAIDSNVNANLTPEVFNTPNKDGILAKAKAGSPSDGLSVASTVKSSPNHPDRPVLVDKENGDAQIKAEHALQAPGSLLPQFVSLDAQKPKTVGSKKKAAAAVDASSKPKGKGKTLDSKSPIKKEKRKYTKKADREGKDASGAGKARKKPKGGEEQKKSSPSKPSKRSLALAGTEDAVEDEETPELQKASMVDAGALPGVEGAAEESEQDKEGEWRTCGSHFLGRRVVRTTLNDDGSSAATFATVTGWLPADESDFVNDDGVPAALWHLRYEDSALGEEDLEEHEVEEAVRAFELSAKTTNAACQSDIDRILVDAPMHIVKKEGTKVGEVAKELGIDVQDLIALNVARYAGLKSGSRLKKETLLFYSTSPVPRASALCSPPPSKLKTEDVMEVEQDSAKPPPQHSPQNNMIREKDAKKDAQVPPLVASQQADSPPILEEAQSAAPDCAAQPKEVLEPRTDWHFAKRPVLEFPAYPGVTEADGKVMATKFRCAFTCPFKIVDGVVYATPGFEAVAPITATVEDSWAECDGCKKWRRLPPTLIVGEGAEFFCSEIGRSCQDAEDDWDDGEEMEVANDTMKTIEAKLPLQIGDLTVTALGEVVADKAGYWNKSYIFPIGYTCTRKYVTDEESKQETEFLCQIEADDDGPVFRVTPKDDQGQLLQELSASGKTARSAWVRALAIVKDPALAKEGGTDDAEKQQADLEDESAEAAESQEDEDLGAGESAAGLAPGNLDLDGGMRRPAGEEEGEEGACAMQVDEEQEREHGGKEGEEEGAQRGSKDEEEGKRREGGRKREEEDEKKKAQINGNALFGFGLARVVELLEALPGADEILATRDALRRKENLSLSVSERMRDMPKHLFDDPNSRVPIRNRANGHILIGKDAPKRKNIMKYLKENATMEAIDPSKLSKADMAGLQGASQVHICWDCKKGMFASKKNTKIICRFQLGHSGPDWKNDPRAKSDNALDPFAHVRLPASFKYRWKEGCIVTLDYNKQGAPTLVRMPKQFVQDALQVDISWLESVDEGGWPRIEAHLEKRELEAPNRAPRKVYRRPALPVQLPENPSGCARAECFVRKSFTHKAEFTHMAQAHFPRLLSPAEYTSMSDVRKFTWMKETQNKRLAIGNSGIEGYGIFARRPIYKGEMVVEYTGEAIRPVLADLREERYEAAGIGTYFWRLEEHLGAGEPLEGRAAIVDATVKHNIGHYINHCCDPNCEAKITRINGQRRIIIFAIHDIEFGEELTYDYKLPFEDNKIPCHCGANACRGTLN